MRLSALLPGSLGGRLNLTFPLIFFSMRRLPLYLSEKINLLRKQKNRSCQHTHYGCEDNSGHLVSRIRIRCSVACQITDKQAGTAAGHPAAHQPGTQLLCLCDYLPFTTIILMVHAHVKDRSALYTFDTDIAHDIRFHVVHTLFTVWAFYLYRC